MKTHMLFCCLLTVITCCVFTWKAETSTGQALGYTALVISTLAIVKNIVIKMDSGKVDVYIMLM